MTGLCTFLLRLFLFFFYSIAVLANKPSAKTITNFSTKQNKLKIASPTPPSTPATPQAHPKKHLYIRETMRMQKAWIYSTVLPGFGQAYNQHYWKIPAIYTVFCALGWGAIYKHQCYIDSKRQLIQNPNSNHSLRHEVDFSRAERDLYIIFSALWYIANIFDAYVGASLKTFNLSDDLSLEIQPGVSSTKESTPKKRIGLALSLKKK